ncbi:hypothetical protein IKQ26_00910 [bacterium]|nr:hypothetical protein [bacterium]
MNNPNYYNILDEEDLHIDLKKIFLSVWSRRILIKKVFIYTLIFFIVLTFILPKKWKVESDLYINKSNNSNLAEFNPYVIDEMGSLSLGSIGDKVMMNELELIQCPLVIDKVIRENDLRFKKLFNIFPTAKTGEYLTTEKFLKKKIKFENKKGTSIISISYKSKEKDEAYSVVESIIKNYIELHTELNSAKSQSDIEILEAEYQKAKESLNQKVSNTVGIPQNAMTNSANLAIMSAYTTTAQKAMANLKSQYLEGEKSKVDITEDSQKVAQLSSKLEWAKLVEKMADSSKVLVIKEPYPLRDWEYSSPKLLINILLGIVFGIIFSIIAVIYKETTDKKLSYSMLGDNIIYDLEEDFGTLSVEILSNTNEKNAFIMFEEIQGQIMEKLKQFKNVTFTEAGITKECTDTINEADKIILVAGIGKTKSAHYKLIKKMISNLNKKITYEVLA